MRVNRWKISRAAGQSVCGLDQVVWCECVVCGNSVAAELKRLPRCCVRCLGPFGGFDPLIYLSGFVCSLVNRPDGWTVVEYAGRRGGVEVALCECRCGAVDDVPLLALADGSSRECRACRARRRVAGLEVGPDDDEPDLWIDLAGYLIGDWWVTEALPGVRVPRWRCSCVGCNGQSILREATIRAGRGCLKCSDARLKMKEHEFVKGEQVGPFRLVRSRGRGRERLWECRCLWCDELSHEPEFILRARLLGEERLRPYASGCRSCVREGRSDMDGFEDMEV